MTLRFNNAIVRTPSRSVTQGLRAVDTGAPNYETLLAEHAAYVAALEQAGVAVDVLPPLEAYPDSVFVEDAALVFTNAAIQLRPGAPTRAGEAAEIAPTLARRFERVLQLEAGTAEGGDILTTPRGVLIGQSARTSAEGAQALVALLAQLGLKGIPVQTPPGVLHFKSDCSLLDDETILATPALAASGVFDGFRVVLTPDGEEGAANAIRVNDRVFLSAGYPRAADALTQLGFRIVTLQTREIAKIDAGLSCMSLRWRG
ncbi:dimethylarginine dimethylaminohydrolase family protein [Terricaulis silvestris]|uniref:N(G),N(G)-dimethylarginine dimethylaminohydrolase n=1 Tax=Terricaulis silvestris TaxID=2686094 RepID=A0A6I6MKN7_9CAUL|nr:dimethylarginine dimethylaminohydrolase [Terricaulis silvestris]QGZ94561.1 N(G),N(G)-dimethylarginine dimethylaminohydrolase [Terricaulis silvestris]